MKEVTVKREDGAIAFSLCCEIDHHTARILREQIDGGMRASDEPVVILDFSGVGFMDSSGIGLLLGRAEEASRLGKRIVVRKMTPSVFRIIRMSGIERIGCIKIEKEGI